MTITSHRPHHFSTPRVTEILRPAGRIPSMTQAELVRWSLLVRPVAPGDMRPREVV